MTTKRSNISKSINVDDEVFDEWRFETINTTTNLPSNDDIYPIEFKFNTSENEYLDPRMFLKLELKITQANCTAFQNEVATVADPNKPAVGTRGSADYRPPGIIQTQNVTNGGVINGLLM